MATIEIDFDVFKSLTARRDSEDKTYNDVLRDLLGLSPREFNTATKDKTFQEGDWIPKGVHFPPGTEFRAKYKGSLHRAKVEDGSLMLNGKKYNSPSSAAGAITGTFVNGWNFWECRFPGELHWKIIKTLRNSHNV
jgi:hypothetical protein